MVSASAIRQLRRPSRILAALLLVIAGAACGGDDPVVEGPPTPTAASTASAPASDSPGATTGAPPASPGASAPAKLTAPEEAADHLYQAWKRGDREAAALFAQPAAVDALFARPYSGPDPEFMGCDHEVDHY